jgi:hypothetical protein
VSTHLPLAAARLRLQRPPGRPRKEGEKEKAAATRQARKTAAAAAITPRLLDLEQGAKYLSCSCWTLRDLESSGVLRRVRVPLPNGGELRKLLFDVQDLDVLISQWKDGGGR